ncbi:hypothetical protein Taro_032258, partial [Colocasia esculenta]|nr:hypothetical protein [Colocasia esculenta]
FPRTVLCSFLVAVELPSRLRCITWLLGVLVRFPRTVCCCPGEGFSQDYFVLISFVAVLPQPLRYAVVLDGAFWRVFLQRCLGGSGGGSPRTCLHCFCLLQCSLYWSVLIGRWVAHSGEGSSQDRPLSLLAKVLPRSVLCSFRATICAVGWAAFWRGSPRTALGAFVCLGVVGQGVVHLTVCLAIALAKLSRCSFPSFSIVLVVGGPRLRIPSVCLSADVATARCVAISEEASAQ